MDADRTAASYFGIRIAGNPEIARGDRRLALAIRLIAAVRRAALRRTALRHTGDASAQGDAIVRAVAIPMGGV